MSRGWDQCPLRLFFYSEMSFRGPDRTSNEEGDFNSLPLTNTTLVLNRTVKSKNHTPPTEVDKSLSREYFTVHTFSYEYYIRYFDPLCDENKVREQF